VKGTPTLTINDESGTVRALAIRKSTHLCKSFNTITGVTPETENPDWLLSTSHALPCLYVLIVIGLGWETTLANGMAMLNVASSTTHLGCSGSTCPLLNFRANAISLESIRPSGGGCQRRNRFIFVMKAMSSSVWQRRIPPRCARHT